MAERAPHPDPAPESNGPPSPDAHAQAALILIESLIHSLLDNGRLTRAQAVEAIDSAHDVTQEQAEHGGGARTPLSLLKAMRRSILAHYDRGDPGAGDPGAGEERRDAGTASE